MGLDHQWQQGRRLRDVESRWLEIGQLSLDAGRLTLCLSLPLAFKLRFDRKIVRT